MSAVGEVEGTLEGLAEVGIGDGSDEVGAFEGNMDGRWEGIDDVGVNDGNDEEGRFVGNALVLLLGALEGSGTHSLTIQLFLPQNHVTFNKEVVHFGNLLRYLLAASARNMTLKTLQPGHWEVKEFFYAKLATFLQPSLST